MTDIKAKVVVVTGGMGLLGREILKELRKLGAIAISADICEENESEKSLNIDITDPVSVQACLDKVINMHGRLDGWVNNAYPRTTDWHLQLEDIPFSSWQKNVDMHLNGYFLCSQLALKHMKSQNSGCLINMCSIYGVVGPDFSLYQGTKMTMPAAYSAIKGALINLTRYCAAYYGPNNVRVNAISPGGIFDNQPESFHDRYNEKVPMRRMGTPNDIAPAVAFLLSDSCAYITGQNLIIDGGWTVI